MFKNNLTLCRFILRRDFFRSLIWYTAILALVVGFGAGIYEMYPDQQGLDDMLVSLENPAFVAMIGPATLTEDGTLTLGGMYAVYMIVWTALIVALMNVFLVVRHTRQDEERGRIEVIRSLPVGRLANLSSTLTAAVILNALLTLLMGLGLGAVGVAERGMGFEGAFVFSAACGAFGLLAAGVTAIFCQLNKNPGSAMALSIGFLVILYVISAAGHIQKNEIIAGISMLGLVVKAGAYVTNDWILILIILAVAAVLMIKSLWLCKMRDMGESFLPARPGKRDAYPYLKSPAALAWRMVKIPFIAWTLTVPLLGMAYGSVMGELESFIGSNELFMRISQGDPMIMVSFLIMVMGLCACLPVLHFTLKVRGQEKRGYTENILARSATRSAQLRGYFIFGLIGSILMPFMNAVGFYAGAAYSMEDGSVLFERMFMACMVYVPAVLVIMGIAVFLNGFFPKLTGWAWGYVGYSFAVIYLGSMMQLPEFFQKLTPFGHTPMLPRVPEIGTMPVFDETGAQMLDETGKLMTVPIFGEATYELSNGNIAALCVMTGIAAALFILGFIGHKRREMKFSH